MVTRFGMSDTFGMMGLATVSDQYLEGRAQLTCGEETASKIDGEVNRMIKNCYDEAYSLLKEHRHTLDRIAAYLYKKETITGKEFMKLFRILEGQPENEEDAGITLDPAATDPSNTISPEEEKLLEEKKEETASEAEGAGSEE